MPSLTRIYPNGQEDVNAFHEAGGTPFLIRELLAGGYLHNDVHTVMGPGLEQYARMPELDDGKPAWKPAAEQVPCRRYSVVWPSLLRRMVGSGCWRAIWAGA